MNKYIKVGFSRVDITPEEYVSLGGFGNEPTRICTNVIDRIFGTCIAISDEQGQSFLLFSTDLINVYVRIVAMAREAISAATGIPGERIMIAATHTHAGPGVARGDIPAIGRYYSHFAKQLTKAAVDALADQHDATIAIGQRIVESMTFVRHYLMNDGSYAGANFGNLKSGFKGHTDTSDDQMQLIRFQRQGARDIILLNWQSHATITSAGIRTDMSADYIGTMRDHIEGMTGCHFIFFQGAAGNLVPSSRIPEEMIVAHDHILYGRKLAEFVLEGITDLRNVNSGPIHTKQLMYSAAVDHSDDSLVPSAQAVLDQFYTFEDPATARKFVKDNGFNSIAHVKGILSRANGGDHMEVELNALSVGDISFVTAPYEMFCSNGKYIKEHTPFEITFIMGYCNNSFSYIPDEKAFGYNCYEVNVRRFGIGTAEDIAQTHVRMLEELRSCD